jgi:hypothetical protein
MSLTSEHSFSTQLAEIGGVKVRDDDFETFKRLVEKLHNFHIERIPKIQSGWKVELLSSRASELVARLQLMRHLREDEVMASNLKKEAALGEYLRLLHTEYELPQCHATTTKAGALDIQGGPQTSTEPPAAQVASPVRHSSRVKTDSALLAAIQALTRQVADLAAGQQKLENRQSKLDKVQQQDSQERQFANLEDIQTAAKVVHQFQQKPRPVRLSHALRNKQSLDLDAKDMKTIDDFMDTPLDSQVRARAPFLEPSLLPRFAVHAKEEAARLLAQSVDSVARSRKFQSAAEFHRGLKQEMAGAISRQDIAEWRTNVRKSRT